MKIAPTHAALRLVLCGTLLYAPAIHANAQQSPKFDVVSLTAGINLIRAEVAAAPEQREQGLMFRRNMAPNDGMIFVFEGPAEVCMWMKNTLLPLSVAVIDGSGRSVNIEDMQPQALASHCAKRRVRYAVEMNLGWFKQKNIKPGTTIHGLPAIQ
ncbi:MAG: DUF192 domain-containing protein [Burkholderiaceae bacterium]